MEVDDPSKSQIRVRLSTRDKEFTLEDAAPVLVPTSFRRYALSTLVNGLLKNEKSVPFEFLVNGSYLRTTLYEYLSTNGISTETTLPIEYVRARIPPQYIASFEHDDWVSSVDVLSSTSPAAKHLPESQKPSQSRILSSSYDGRLRVWNTSSQLLAISSDSSDGGHSSFVKSAKFASPTQIVSAGFDRTVKVWKYTEDDQGFSADLIPQIDLYGHKGSVDSIDVHCPSSRILSASADHSVGFWSLKRSDAPPAPENLIPKTTTKDGKRRRINPSRTVPQRGPLSLFQSHTGPVSGAQFDFNDSTVGYSTSWDQSLRTWDLVTSALVDTRTTSHALYCIEQMPDLHLIAAGSAGRDIKLIDPRDSATTVIAMTLKGHKNSVVTLARDPTNNYTLVSGSHDGTCRVWDVRSTSKGKEGVTGQSLYTLARESQKGVPAPAVGDGVKVFGVCWDREIGILSGGEDKVVQINRGD